MRRTKSTPKKDTPKIPDAINSSVTENFTQVPNELLRNPDLSFKAKGILCLLLSNRKGWRSYLETLTQMSKEGIPSIKSGIKELEKANYLMRVQYREKETKIRRGSFWAYTDIPGNFNMEHTLHKLEKAGLEAFVYSRNISEKPQVGFPPVEKPPVEKPQVENQRLIILNYKKTNKNKNNNLSREFFDSKEIINEEETSSKKEKDPKYLELANKLYQIIRSSKNIKFSQTKILQWADEIRKLVEKNEVEVERVERALDWYADNIKGEYVPVIECGRALRDKFVKLENAVERDSKSGKRKSKYSKIDVMEF